MRPGVMAPEDVAARPRFVWRNVILAVAGAGLLAGCSSAPRAPLPIGLSQSISASSPAQPARHVPAAATVVTGYRQLADLSGSQHTEGAVHVKVSRAQARHLSSLVAALPNGAEPMCMEPPILTYRIHFGVGASTMRNARVTGYRCVAAVSIKRPDAPRMWRSDMSCRLLKAVRKVLPTAAGGTRSATVGCR